MEVHAMVALALLLLLELALGLAQPPNSNDVERLLAFKGSLDNGNSVLASWTAGTDPCSGWQGISCSASSRVVRMWVNYPPACLAACAVPSRQK